MREPTDKGINGHQLQRSWVFKKPIQKLTSKFMQQYEYYQYELVIHYITTTTIDRDIDHFKRNKNQKIKPNQGQFADNSLSF